MASLTRFLERLASVEGEPSSKSVVDRPWNGTFLGYTVTNNLQPAPEAGAEVR